MNNGLISISTDVIEHSNQEHLGEKRVQLVSRSQVKEGRAETQAGTRVETVGKCHLLAHSL